MTNNIALIILSMAIIFSVFGTSSADDNNPPNTQRYNAIAEGKQDFAVRKQRMLQMIDQRVNHLLKMKTCIQYAQPGHLRDCLER